MRKILLFVCFVFCWMIGKSQYPVNQSIGSPKTLVTSKGGLGTTDGLAFVTNFTDTTEANNYDIDISAIPGFLIRVNNTEFWVRNEAATQWVKISGGGSGAEPLFPLTGTGTATGNVTGD